MCNIVADAVVQEWYACIEMIQLCRLSVFFYADDGHMAGKDPAMLQDGLNIIIDLFQHLGLSMNSTKMKAMISFDMGQKA